MENNNDRRCAQYTYIHAREALVSISLLENVILPISKKYEIQISISEEIFEISFILDYESVDLTLNKSKIIINHDKSYIVNHRSYDYLNIRTTS